MTEPEPALQVAELRAAFDDRAENETTAPVCHDIEGRWLLGERLEQHASVTLRRPADGEMIEAENAIPVRGFDPIEKSRSLPAVEKPTQCSRTIRAGTAASVAARPAPRSRARQLQVLRCETLTQPSASPARFHASCSNSTASRGSARLTALSPAALATLMTIALTALSPSPRELDGGTRTWNRSSDAPRVPRTRASIGNEKVNAPEAWRRATIAVSPAPTSQVRSIAPLASTERARAAEAGCNHGLLADARLARQELFGQRSEIVVNRSGRSRATGCCGEAPSPVS